MRSENLKLVTQDNNEIKYSKAIHRKKMAYFLKFMPPTLLQTSYSWYFILFFFLYTSKCILAKNHIFVLNKESVLETVKLNSFPNIYLNYEPVRVSSMA